MIAQGGRTTQRVVPLSRLGESSDFSRLSESCVPHGHQSAEPPARKQRVQANLVRHENLTRDYQVGSCGSGTRGKEPSDSRWNDPRSVKRHVSPTDRDRWF